MKQGRFSTNKAARALVAVTLIAASLFQNCGGGFKTLDGMSQGIRADFNANGDGDSKKCFVSITRAQVAGGDIKFDQVGSSTTRVPGPDYFADCAAELPKLHAATCAKFDVGFGYGYLILVYKDVDNIENEARGNGNCPTQMKSCRIETDIHGAETVRIHPVDAASRCANEGVRFWNDICARVANTTFSLKTKILETGYTEEATRYCENNQRSFTPPSNSGNGTPPTLPPTSPPTNQCDPRTQPYPHYQVAGGRCLPSCGLAAGPGAVAAPKGGLCPTGYRYVQAFEEYTQNFLCCSPN